MRDRGVAPTPLELNPDERARLALRDAPRQSDFGDVRLPELPAVPGMIRASEARYLYWLASRAYLGRGAVVELGSFLGKSATHLAAGLRDGGRGGELYCHDRFRWDAEHRAHTDLGLELGADYRGVFERNLRGVFDGVHAIATEIRELRWDRGPVEILFLDAPKRVPELSSALATFAPVLEPQTSLLVFQDLVHAPSYAITLCVSVLGDALELVHVVEGGGTASFVLRRPLVLDAATIRAFEFKRWSREELERRWHAVFDRIELAEARARLAPGLCMALWDRGERDEAVRRVRELEFTPDLQSHWEQLSRGRMYERYEGLFVARGFVRAREPRSMLTRLARAFGLRRR